MGNSTDKFDLAIIGGGIAGCYAAYRLMEQASDPNTVLGKIKAKNGKLNVGLFEYSGRVGGRLLSAQLPQQADNDKPIGLNTDNPRKYAEFGGFRFQNQMHIVRDLADHLGLEQEAFPVDEPPANFVYVRGKRLTRGEVNSGQNLPYYFTDTEQAIVQGLYADTGNPDLSTYVSNQAFSGVLPNGPGATPEMPNGYQTLRTAYQTAFKNQDWNAVTALREQYESAKQNAVVEKRPLKDWSWWALRSNYLSPEALAFMEDTGGYNSLWAPGNVSSELAEDFYFANEGDVFGKNGSPDPCNQTVWAHITTGYSDIPNQLYTKFLAAGGQGFPNYQLISFDKENGGGYNLTFYKRKPGETTSPAQAEQACAQGQDCVTINADMIILALPQRALQLIDQDNFFFLGQTDSGQNVSDLLNNTVLNDPAIRIFMAYDKPWWTEKNMCCGRSTTDLPVRQFYYWYTAGQNDANQNSYLLASYSNGEAEKYWYSLQNGERFNATPGAADKQGRHDAPQKTGPRGAKTTMAQLAHRQIAEVVGLPDAPEPYYAHYQNWTKDPWGAGWHAWTAGNSDNELIPQIFQPLSGEDVFICGECYSNVQGWVQGALNSTETLLQNNFGLAWPDWLTKGGTWLGPGSKDPGQ